MAEVDGVLVAGAGALGSVFGGLLARHGAAVTLLGLMSPLVAITVGYVVLDQHLGLQQVAGMAVVLTALWVGQQQPARTVPAIHAVPADGPTPEMDGESRRTSVVTA